MDAGAEITVSVFATKPRTTIRSPNKTFADGTYNIRIPANETGEGSVTGKPAGIMITLELERRNRKARI
jgi:hypothetical protein